MRVRVQEACLLPSIGWRMDFYQQLNDQAGTLAPQTLLDLLLDHLRAQRDYAGLFQAMLLEARARLGLPLVLPQVESSQVIPASLQEPYEEAIRQAAHAVGHLFLDNQDVVGAWPYFRLIGEIEPVAKFLETIPTPTEEQFPTMFALAWQEGVHPKLGFQWVLQHRGLCNAITTLTQSNVHQDIRNDCVIRLLEALHAELIDRLQHDLSQRGLVPPEPVPSLPALLKALPQDAPEDLYHIDLSHLNSVLEMALELPPGPGIEQAFELSTYGQRLHPRFQPVNDPPFKEGYAAFAKFFQALLGSDAASALGYFRDQADRAKQEGGSSSCGEVLVHLLYHLGRFKEALDAYAAYLAAVPPRELRCPSLSEISVQSGDFAAWRHWCQERQDAVGFVTCLLLKKQSGAGETKK